MDASVDSKVRDFHFWENFSFERLPHLAGHLRVTNRAEAPQKFSTAMVRVGANSLAPARAYVNSVASHVADSSIEVKREEPLELSVYWPVSLEIGAVIEQPALKCVLANNALERTGDHGGRAVLAMDCVLGGAEWAACQAAQLGR